jgi:hypothetical protein
MNVSAFERVMEREFSSYLKHMNELGLLSVSLKEARSAIASGIPVVKAAKKSGRPKKEERVVSDDDIIADLTAKATSTTAVPKSKRKKLTAEEKVEKKRAAAEKKAAAKLEKAKLAEEKKAKKALLKAKLAEEKKEKKRLEKEAKDLAKSQAKAAKLAAKQAEKDAKKLERENAKAAKLALKKKKTAEAKAKLAAKKAEALKQSAQLKNAPELTEESYQDEDIVNDNGEVIGNKAVDFVVPPTAQELAKQKKLEAAGLKPFSHKSLPEDELYIDSENSVWRMNEANTNVDHIGSYSKEHDAILAVSDSDDDSEMEELDLSDTE